MIGKNPILDGGRELQDLSLKDVYLGNILSRIIGAVNSMAQNIGIAPIGKLSPPPPVNSITVSGSAPNSNGIITCPAEILHWTITHNGPIQKGIQYISEIDTNPNFPQPFQIDHGCSRVGFLHLPTLDTNGNTHTYYLRSYAQYHGSDPTDPYVLGGMSGAIGIQMTGTSQTSLLSSTGSGTSQATGQQGGQGLGVFLTRPAPSPKRSVGSNG